MKGLITVSDTWKSYAEVLCYNVFRLWEGRRWSLPEPKLYHISPERALQRETLGMLQWLSWYFPSWAVTIYLMLKPFIPFEKQQRIEVSWAVIVHVFLIFIGSLGMSCNAYWSSSQLLHLLPEIPLPLPLHDITACAYSLYCPHILGCGTFTGTWLTHRGTHPFRTPTLPLPVAISCQYLLSNG